MGSSNPVTGKERQRVRELHAAGKGRNEIAAELGRSGRTISEIAKGLGLSFARAAEVRQATEIRQADLADRRARFAVELQDLAEREIKKINQPYEYWDWGGKEHDFDTHVAPEPTPGDKRALMATVATALDRSLKLAPPEQDAEGLAAVDAWLKGMMGGT
ncbi:MULTISPECIES: helix-turn-helix domain-containing protein [unclassified Streptomyces]|uniref:helix-turn-helix domain-containing protein n=1 Tax=unclassified Streptomyces TaxID=2593676 RepID=UPI00190C892F|nr:MULTISPECIES: helix-turn-helix domain-containing protein [unclassified Streptomyces]MBK3563212.1 helix-turn-helix domain-containing protein [Streptomyces sp. MBT62]MBK6013201.1 helix-turn-helix domain-containing protein [Streptomyces sp. MBT53]